MAELGFDPRLSGSDLGSPSCVPCLWVWIGRRGSRWQENKTGLWWVGGHEAQERLRLSPFAYTEDMPKIETNHTQYYIHEFHLWKDIMCLLLYINLKSIKDLHHSIWTFHLHMKNLRQRDLDITSYLFTSRAKKPNTFPLVFLIWCHFIPTSPPLVLTWTKISCIIVLLQDPAS